jgi:hypothetical protein
MKGNFKDRDKINEPNNSDELSYLISKDTSKLSERVVIHAYVARNISETA